MNDIFFDNANDKGSSSQKETIAVNLYFKDIRKFKQLKSDEQIELAIKAKSGDKLSQDKLIESNQRFVVSIAKEYRNLGLDLEDLISEGNIGLIKAITKYDKDRGVRFLSYAVWWIRQSMLQAIYETADTVRLPVNKINILNKINKIKESLSQSLNREPTISDVCENSDLNEEEVSIVYDGNRSVSLEERVSDDSEQCLLDFIPSDDYSNLEIRINKEYLMDEVDGILNSLTEREAEIISRYFGLRGFEPMTLKEIGESLDLTNERVRQIKENATKKLRSHSKASKLKEFYAKNN